MSNFAQEWLQAWNSHQLDSIMSHYAEDVVFYSPFIIKINNDPAGNLQGKMALQAYFSKALTAYPDLHFELIQVLEGVNSFLLYYRSVDNRLSAEMMVLNHEGKVKEVRAHYA
ncbi:nuclear transport factor 2 family protein [Chitinophaga sancti]|uniref:Nuclear transport factor 2 family protein n=1 Tax=Chitinophaga sancti TaxID=1004 RepID=A0A1K1SDQ9_9BACT|nr:nuclear transport factor 2 family protein [Chitinophaga sancti]WQD59961.1 nuclear transport factor 2 family protein [Chitinophaga sancti]WQG87909.1 nuclear transport factor 2 family protein [Chitinophaga sancti]SFW82521.1 SnoaL-like domain-containing protein [Chitinophaga sancti]